MRRGRSAMCVLALGASAVAGGAAASSARPAARSAALPVHVTVRPARGAPRSHFAISFRARGGSASGSSMERHYTLTATGPRGRGCLSSATASAITTQTGRLEHVILAPRGYGWCRGAWHGRVALFLTPNCSGPPRSVCPLFVIDVGVVGRFRFRVR